MTEPKLLLQNRLEPTSPTVARVERMQLAAQQPAIKEARQAPKRKTEEKRTGHHRRLTRDEKIVVRTLRNIANCRQHRKIAWNHLPFYVPGLERYGEDAINSAMKSLGYSRIIRRRQVKLTAQQKKARKRFAERWLQLKPNPEDWLETSPVPILFTDETWAYTNGNFKQWFTIHVCEDPSDFDLLRIKGHGWMFWGSMCGRQKGPCFIWPKEYGGITAEKYIEYILPLIVQWRDGGRPTMILQQDNAPAHAARIMKYTVCNVYGIPLMEWPAKSPDLNPMENVWSWMKNWLYLHYDTDHMTLRELWYALYEAWKAIPESLLENIARSMPDRLRKVIENDGDMSGY
ncbi:hypothetical protein DL771_004167 [Monosporascus sp. 5C6A]|nr:hypothetical protein DL771_004167 [Monosporascus sp. 5C6A]